MQLLEEVSRLTKHFPQSESSRLTQQLQRSAMSVVSNIGEGFSRVTKPDKAHKYTIARGECTETYVHLQIAIQQKYITRESAQKAVSLSQEVGKILTTLIRTFSSTPT